MSKRRGYPAHMAIRTTRRALALPSVPLEEVARLPMAPGIYFAIVNQKHVVYVGVTATTLNERWKNHHRRFSIEKLGPARIAYIECDDYRATCRAEEDAIHYLRPVLNYRADFQVRALIESGELIRGIRPRVCKQPGCRVCIRQPAYQAMIRQYRKPS